MSEQNKVFISYAREDYEIAKRLYDDLKDAGVVPWMDKINILIGQKWKYEIRKAIKESSHFLALLSSNSISKRGYVQKELKMGLDIFDEMPQSKIFLLPIRLDECHPLDETLQALQWGDLFPESEYKDGLIQILRVLAPEGKSVPVSEPPKKKPDTSKAKEIGRDGNFIAYDNGTVLDTKTGLMWAAQDKPVKPFHVRLNIYSDIKTLYAHIDIQPVPRLAMPEPRYLKMLHASFRSPIRIQPASMPRGLGLSWSG